MSARYGAVDVARMLGRPAPTPEQVAVIEAPLEPMLVVAGAGSGKTETMTARVVHLVVNGMVERDRVLGLTFTRKAAGELGERVRRRLRALDRVIGTRDADPLAGPTVSTYNAYAGGLVGEHALRLGVEPSARVIGDAARWQLATELVEGWPEDLGTDSAPSTVTNAVLDLAGELAEHLVEPEDLRDLATGLVEHIAGLPAAGRRGMVQELQKVMASLRLRAHLVDLVVAFVERKRAREVIDFGDQVALAARLARLAEVAAAERAKFSVVLLDEYQDTSVAQLELLSQLFGSASASGAGHPVTAVGDPHQSIYGWRGAGAGGLERFGTQFARRPGGDPAAVYTLSTSWRNDHAVLAVANTIAGPLREAAERSAHPLRLPLLGARPDAGPGQVVIGVASTVAEEARAVAAFIAARRGSGVTGDRPVTSAVLCRARKQFPVLHEALVEAGLPVQVVGLGGLLNLPAVADVVAALEAAHDPSRGDSLMRLLTGPRLRLGMADLQALGDWSHAFAARTCPTRNTAPSAPRGVVTAEPGGTSGGAAGSGVVPEGDVVDERSLVDALDDLPPEGWVSPHGRSLTTTGRSRLAELADVLRTLRRHTYLPVVELVAQAERLLRLDIEVAARPGAPAAVARAELDALRAAAAAFDEDDEAGTLGAFLAWLAAAQAEERGLDVPLTEPDPHAVQLLTVHAAKGLEWDVVAVPGLVDGGFPVRAGGLGWLRTLGDLPTPLRGDRDALPHVDVLGSADLGVLRDRIEVFAADHVAHQLAEERRLAYVAMTRAARDLLLTGARWGEQVKPREPSVFLTEVTEAGDRGELPVVTAPWSVPPTDDAPVRPDTAAPTGASWPAQAPLGTRQEVVEAAAAAVREASTAPDGLPAPSGALTTEPAAEIAELSSTVDLLLAERAARSTPGSIRLPTHLSASAVVSLAADRREFARQLRRPVPSAPSTVARRGTAFHAWVESYYASAALVDVDALPGADDDSAADVELARLQRAFLGSEWAERTPVAVEVDVQTVLDGVVLRSRIDAVFAEPDGRTVVVDWKTGRAPTEPEQVRARELQLAVYRLAWSRWQGVPVQDVDAVLYYVATGESVRMSTPLVEEAILEVLRAGLPD